MSTSGIERARFRLVDGLIGIVVLGSLWGLSEVVLAGAIRAAGLPWRAGILTGVGMGIMAIAVGLFGISSMPIAIALVAVLCKQLVVPILHVSVMCKVNSCLAVMLESLALAGTVTLMRHRLRKRRLFRIVSGASAGLLAAIAFYFIGMRVAPCRYLLSFDRPGGFQAFLAAEGLVWAIFSGILFPVGYWAGERLVRAVPRLRTKSPLFYYTTSAALVLCCWVASALAIAAGL